MHYNIEYSGEKEHGMIQYEATQKRQIYAQSTDLNYLWVFVVDSSIVQTICGFHCANCRFVCMRFHDAVCEYARYNLRTV